MGFVILWDETGVIRLQKLLGYGEQKLAVGIDGEHTTIGGVPGKVSKGEWKLGIGIFTEYVQQRLGDKTEVLEVVLTDREIPIADPIGAQVWVEEGTPKMSFENYNWKEKYDYPMEKKPRYTPWKRQKKWKWIFMYQRSIT
ncbi:MAG: hypothetical protein BHW46_03040 [Roseburia intestinalis]|nr:MAG: hypothetical protein BHW46_03040 [Roseburia intestinalis]